MTLRAHMIFCDFVGAHETNSFNHFSHGVLPLILTLLSYLFVLKNFHQGINAEANERIMVILWMIYKLSSTVFLNRLLTRTFNFIMEDVLSIIGASRGYSLHVDVNSKKSSKWQTLKWFWNFWNSPKKSWFCHDQ